MVQNFSLLIRHCPVSTLTSFLVGVLCNINSLINMSKILCNIGQDVLKLKHQHDILLSKVALKLTTVIPARTKYYHNRHCDPKYRVLRHRKMWVPLDMPDFDHERKEQKDKATPDEIRSKMKEKGIAPPNPWDEREVFSPCTMSLIEPYKPAGGDGKSSSLLKTFKAPLATGTEMVKNRRNLGVVRNYEGEDFELESFARQSLDIYKRAHELLAANDEEEIFNYVTEHCYPVMKAGMKRHSIIWKFLDEIEPASVVQVRASDLVQKGNKYGQITVRFHSKQIMAAFDRHGRLVLGSPTDVKEVFEYVVFEKYLSNEYGLWRVHEKIRPEQAEPSIKPMALRTHVYIK
uniref:Large ribosomal subunit protein mL45 n=1 Tax=Aceria tosichella TaxID=561515 RepID=A0A6G1SP68_9ACAR